VQISVILSDYDGTLCQTTSIRSKENTIPEELENILWDISKKIPICIVSSKDFEFLHSRTRFASIVSCILGIETLVLQRHEKTRGISADSEDNILECQAFKCVKSNFMSVDDETLQYNSQVLSQLIEQIRSDFKEVRIEQKFTVTGKKALAGITIDWRHLQDWKYFKTKLEPQLKKVITEKQRGLNPKRSNIHVQTYATHPFIDIYATFCDKGMAYDSVLSHIPPIKREQHTIMYLGDSENDNPAFRKADISIGIKSDKRLNPILDCKYILEFDKLSGFLEKLKYDDFMFSGL
jgi:hydroxymethylpyrimidine pyrophosphatase-like HAD family hydrolase